MELKLQKYKEIQNSNDVLIVPLWNWNPVYEQVQHEATCFNRTFMELKFDVAFQLQHD